ncbi:MAG TPA: diacylglycerol kinase family protein [Rubrobacter sp.]|nr:diacylglycerol kinase family protein [Rubrobacter sp.]
MQRREVHLVFNPAANMGGALARRKVIHSFFEKQAGIEPVWHATERPGHASRIVEALPEDVLVVAVGGDGTVHEVAAACVGTNRTLGVLPVGSGNCYVQALGIGTSLGRALEILVSGKTRVVDAGEVNGVRFNDGLGIGFDAEVAERVARAPAYLGGFGRYLWSVLRLLPGFRCREVTLKLDGQDVVESKTVLVAVALGTTYGGRFKLAPTSRLDDGLFDIVWSEEIGRIEAATLIPAVLRGSHLKHPKIHLAQAREVELAFREATPAHVEGEMLAESRTFSAKVLPAALRVVAP